MKFEYYYVGEFRAEILVECPNCGSKATVTSLSTDAWEDTFVCTNCSSHKIWAGASSFSTTAHSNYRQFGGIIFGPPVDCFFRYPLWYQTDYKGEVLYAYNLAHLAWLKQYVGAKLRERVQTSFGWSNKSLQSRLPQWMLSAKNRATILKKIAELEKK
ncbi:hypothetical protein GCM10027346_30680 [Hymenobacter seoulensis]